MYVCVIQNVHSQSTIIINNELYFDIEIGRLKYNTTYIFLIYYIR